jgi:flagellar biosynthesis/type III secretory pathway chaperone
MLELFNRLQKVLSDQISHYKELFILLHEEKELIKSSSIDELLENNRKKDEVIQQISFLEENCLNIIEQINNKVPIDIRPVTLSQIIRSIKNPRLNTLKNTYSDLISLVHSVKEINEDNKMYINGSLRAVQGSISFLVSCAKAGTPFYEKGGHLKSENLTSAMISEEV